MLHTNTREPVIPTLSHFVGGHPRDLAAERYCDIIDPASGSVIAQAPLASAGQMADVIEIAASAFPAWSATPAAKRAQILFNFRELVNLNLDELAGLVSREHGKTFDDAKGALSRGLEVVEFACGIPHMLKGEFSDTVASGVDSYSLRQPLGVCVGITPFNFPAMVPMWMFPVAVACGNTFVLKPASRVPSASLRLAELFSTAGLPDGVLNVVVGGREAAQVLLTHPQVQAVSFVGSTPVGQHVYETGCAHGKRVQALCGAKNHMLVMPDADLDQAADAALGAAYGSAGERCMAISVLVTVEDGTADALIERLAPRIRNLRIGPFNQHGVEMGPLISRQHLNKVLGHVETGIREGAELVVDGRDLNLPDRAGGSFMGGCLFDRVTPVMRIYREEIFGPVLCIVRAGSYEEAIGLINDHEYGNGVALFTRNGDAARNFVNRVQAGMVGINVPIPVPVAYHSFGGWKRSLFGDHHIHGPEGVRFYTRLKTVTSRWPSGLRSGAQFHFRGGGEH